MWFTLSFSHKPPLNQRARFHAQGTIGAWSTMGHTAYVQTATEDFVIRIYETVENGPALKPAHEFVTSAVVQAGGLHLIFTAKLECELMLAAGRYWISFLSSGTRGSTFFLANEKEAGSPKQESGGAVRENINQSWRSRNIDISFLAGKGFGMQLHGEPKGFVLRKTSDTSLFLLSTIPLKELKLPKACCLTAYNSV